MPGVRVMSGLVMDQDVFRDQSPQPGSLFFKYRLHGRGGEQMLR